MSELSEKTRMPLSFVITLLVFTVTVCGLFWSINSRLSTIEKHIHQDWSYHDQETWALRLANENPSLKVPDPAASTRSGNRPTTATITP